MPQWNRAPKKEKKAYRILPGQGWEVRLWLPTQFREAWLTDKRDKLNGFQVEILDQINAHFAYDVKFLGFGRKSEYRLPDISQWNMGETACYRYKVRVSEPSVRVDAPPPSVWVRGELPETNTQRLEREQRERVQLERAARITEYFAACAETPAPIRPELERTNFSDRPEYMCRAGDPWVPAAGVRGSNQPQEWHPIQNCRCIDCQRARIRNSITPRPMARDWRPDANLYRWELLAQRWGPPPRARLERRTLTQVTADTAVREYVGAELEREGACSCGSCINGTIADRYDSGQVS